MKVEKLLSSKFQILLSFISVSILLRFLSFHYSVIDHDESTYLIIANALLKGANLYSDVIDTKPPGIFLVFSFIQLAFGKSILALRIVGSIILGCSAFFIFQITSILSNSKWHSYFAGITYLILFSLYRFGLSINTELFFAFFTLAGMYCLLKNTTKPAVYYFIGGLLIGCAFIIKYVVLAGVGAISIFLIIQHKKDGRSFLILFYKLFTAAIGLILPFLLCHLYFLWTGRFDDFYYIIYEVTSNYPSSLSWAAAVNQIWKFILMYLPFMVLYFVALKAHPTKNKLGLLSLLWLVFALVMVVLPGKPFKHYYLQLLPSISLLIPFGFEKLILRNLKFDNRILIKVSLLLILCIAFINQSYFLINKDVPRNIAQKLQPLVNPNDLVLADKHLHITYYLLDLNHPSEFVHPTLIFDHAAAFKINTEQKMNEILDKQPKFIIYNKSAHYFESHPRVNRSYYFYDKIEKTTILKRND